MLTAIFSAVLVSFYALYQYYWGLEITRKFVEEKELIYTLSPDFLTRLYTQRAFSTFVYPNTLAGYLILFFPLTVLFSLKFKGKRKILPLIAGMIILWALFLTKSKGGFLSLFVAMVILAFSPLYRKRKVFSILLLLVLLTSLFSFLLWKDILILSRGRELLFGSADIRLSYWKAGLRMFKERPLLGFGTGCFGKVFTRFKEPGREESQMAHNNYLQVASELGIVGILIFLLFWIYVVRFLLNNIQKERIISWGILGSVMAFLFHSLMDFDFYIPGIVFNLFLFLGWLPDSFSEKRNLSERIERRVKIALIISSLLLAFHSLMVIKANVFYEQGMTKREKGDLEGAIRDINTAIRFYPWGEDTYRISYHYRLGELYEKSMEIISPDFWRKAIEEYTKAARLDPYHFSYWEKISFLFLKKGELEESIKYINKAIYCYPSHPRLHREKGEILKVLGREEEARRELEMADKLTFGIHQRR